MSFHYGITPARCRCSMILQKRYHTSLSTCMTNCSQNVVVFPAVFEVLHIDSIPSVNKLSPGEPLLKLLNTVEAAVVRNDTLAAIFREPRPKRIQTGRYRFFFSGDQADNYGQLNALGFTLFVLIHSFIQSSKDCCPAQ